MTTTTSTAIPTSLDENALGTFESGPQQLQTLNDRDIYELELIPAVNPTGSVVVLTDVTGSFTASGLPLNIDATTRIFGDDNAAVFSPDLLAASSGQSAYTFAPTDGDDIFVGVSTASSPAYNPDVSIIDPGANIIFNYNTSIALIKTDLDTDGNGVVDGTEVDALILGTNAAETLIGTEDPDVIIGFGGNDSIQGGNGNDEIDGGSGDDRISGQLGDDCIRGGDGNDAIFGGLGNDEIDGNDGNDTLRGGLGDDNIDGGDGDDLLSGEGGADFLEGGDGNDEINGGLGDDTLDGGDGNDILRGLEDDDTLFGRDGNDDLRGNDGTDILRGGNGNDVLRGQGDRDFLFGDGGRDTLFGGLGDDDLFGGNGNDLLRGGQGDDFLSGGNGNDVLSGELGNDILDGGNGDDIVTGGLGVDTIRGYGDGTDAAERDILIGTADNAVDTFVLGDGGGAFYDQGGFADFAVLRNITIDPRNVTSGVEDNIFLGTNTPAVDYFLADVAIPTPSLGTIVGVGIFFNNGVPNQSNDLVAVIENVFEADIQGGINNDLFTL